MTMKSEEFQDIIEEHTDIDWNKLKRKLPEMKTEHIIGMMMELGLYVNTTIALEISKRKDAVFCLRKFLQDSCNWRWNKEERSWAPVHAIHILAIIKTKEALELLLDIIRYRGNDLDDWLTETVPSLLYAFGEDAIETLKEFTRDETLDTFVRSSASAALFALSKKYPSHKDDIKEHLLKLLNTTADRTFTSLVIIEIARYHDPSMLPEIQNAFDEKRTDEILIQIEDVNSILTDNTYDEYNMHTKDPLEHFSRKEIERFHKMYYAKAEPDEKVGRNDPCPCGSGKKYKKCCGVYS
ncbi:MAG: hypothetical protein DRN71_03255 [Candidatus Nanohalarchaeota archaeon]|nr:MAG: hypothetical protein DRN71_03255 [Candidatus Nanohaloarchaeota archaeon]